MSRITAVTLLLIILVDTAASHVFKVSKADIRKCRCRVLKNGKTMCPHPLIPRNNVKKVLLGCFCSKTNRDKFPEFWPKCRTWMPETPI